MDQEAQTELLIRIDEKLKKIEEQVSDLVNINDRTARLEVKTSFHTKLIWTGITFAVSAFLLVIKIAFI